MQDEIDDRLKRIERKMDWIAQVAWLAALAAVVLVTQEVIFAIWGRSPAIFGLVAGMVVPAWLGLRAYRGLKSN